VKSAARLGHRTRREVWAYLLLLALRAQPNCFCGMGSCLRCTVMIVVVPAGARRRQARKARPGGQGPCGGRAAHRAIVVMCDTADSLTSLSLSVFCAGPPSSSRTAHGRPVGCTCSPPSAASRPHLRNRGEAIGWPQSSTGTSRFMRARNCSALGPSQKLRRAYKSYDHAELRPNIFQFFPHRKCLTETSDRNLTNMFEGKQ